MATVTVIRAEPSPPPVESVMLELSAPEATAVAYVLGRYPFTAESMLARYASPGSLHASGASVHMALVAAGFGEGL